MTGATGPRDADAPDAGDRPRFPPGSNVLVAGGADGEPLEFALSHLLPAGGRSVVVATDLPPATVAGVPAASPPPGTDASLRVVDCTGGDAPAPPDPPVPTVVTAAAADLPSVGEAATAALDGTGGDGDDGGPPATAGLCLDSLSTLVERATVQGVYKLLYLLSRRVRARDLRAFYTWDGPTPEKTLRILGRPLDYRVALDAPAGDRVVPVDGAGGGG
jgi:hypothetical protein